MADKKFSLTLNDEICDLEDRGRDGGREDKLSPKILKVQLMVKL